MSSALANRPMMMSAPVNTRRVWRGLPAVLLSPAMIRLGHIEYSNCIPVHALRLEEGVLAFVGWVVTTGLVLAVLDDTGHAGFAVEKVRAAIDEDPRVGGRLALWARRLMGEALSQSSHFWRWRQ